MKQPHRQSSQLSRRPISRAAVGLIGLLATVGLFALPESGRAQMQISFKPDKTAYMTYEPIAGTLYLVNRAGRDLALADAGDLRWLEFQVIGPDGQLMIPEQGNPSAKPVVLQAGQSYELKVYINSQYAMHRPGSYKVKVRVLFPDMKQYFETKQTNVQVTNGHEMWSQAVGVPAGLPGAGKYRQFALLTFYEGNSSRELYFRLTEMDTGQVTHTYSLGSYYISRPPQYVLDSSNNLHVLHLGGPQSYAYTVISPTGDIVERKNYTNRGTISPALSMVEGGAVKVQGGQILEKNPVSYEQREFRPISERPPGMPSLSGMLRQ